MKASSDTTSAAAAAAAASMAAAAAVAVAWLTVSLLLAGGALAATSPSVVVATTKGPVRGYLHRAATGKPAYTYLGIPYGKPPIGERRFRKPEPVDSWVKEYNASEFSASCWQSVDTFFAGFAGAEMWNPNTPMDEDCLYLNVWQPVSAAARGRATSNLAVVVWIYGGGFYSGTSSLDVYDGKILTSEYNVIVVSMNYRVGSLGFLAFQRDDAPGNVGLLDQVMALEWVRDNIVYFGGDPNRVTLVGESAGAVSVSMHLLSPLSKDLYARAIMESGTANTVWATMSDEVAKSRGLLLAEALRCPDDPNNLDALIECLRGKSPLEIIDREWVTYQICEFPWVPVIDGEFLVETPLASLERRTFKKTNILLGSNREEGSYFIIYQLTDYFQKRENIYVPRAQFPKEMKNLFNFSNSVGHQAIVFQYTDWLDPDDSARTINSFDKAVGDYYFTCNVNRFASAYAGDGQGVYMYYFTHRSSQNQWPKWMGVMHGDEINYVFGEPMNADLPYTADERELSRRIMSYWTNFAKTG
ncbi:PREDICTED: acetylcholinesterase-like, partial [Priapulus caudatus]|uniref:Carboxylic ester hydrolase n=1 Tax=Priapulus caudatus TaxID=37621 RepID=A0ABM1F6B3_PRICU